MEIEGVETTGWWLNRVHKKTPTKFAVLGERSSGTNVTRYVVERATGLQLTTKLGWKHGFVRSVGVPNDTVVFVPCRYPYDWVRSMFHKPWYCRQTMLGLGFSEFIRAAWDTIIDKPIADFGLKRPRYVNVPLLADRDPVTGQMFQNILKMRTAKLRHLIGLGNDICDRVLFRFEAFAARPNEFLNSVAQVFGVDVAQAP